MLKNMKLSTKLMVAFLAVGIIPFAIVSGISLYKSSHALSDQAFQQLEAVRSIKKNQIERFFEERRGDMGVLMDTVDTLRQDAWQKLTAVQQIKRSQIEQYFDERMGDIRVLAANDHLIEALEAFETAYEMDGGRIGGVGWTAAEDQYGQWLKHYQDQFGYYDLFLIDLEGHVVYTVAKESDLGENLVRGDLADSPLGQLFGRARQEPAFQDFESYAPSGGQFAAFSGAPVYRNGEKIGVVALQLPTGPINEIVQRRDGMGETGETYLVGRNNGRTSFRSDMLTMGDGEYVIGRQISTPYIEKALAGESGEQVFTDSGGNLVMVAFNPLDLPDLNWAMVSKINFKEAIAPHVVGEENDFYAKYIEKYGYYDLFLIHPEGLVFYTVTHEADYMTNMVNGKYADSGLGKLVRGVLNTKSFGIADFAPYAPSNGDPAAFIAEPVMKNGQVQVIVALQLSLDAINAIMTERDGMGESGETYLVGQDKLMRSDSYLDQTYHTVEASFANPVRGSVDTKAARQALAGRTGAEIIKDYNGNPVLSAYAPVQVGDLTWALIAEIDKSEAFQAVTAIEWLIGIIALVGVAAILVVALLITRSITRPINQTIDSLTTGAEQVTSASTQVSGASQSLAEGASEQAAALEETSSSLEEMTSMTRQNAENASQADGLMRETSKTVDRAGQSMTQMNQAMGDISEAGQEIGKIIKTIDEIAFQTNLLALNAAVEAARAGEAGAGFAVVADEVRNLAGRAAEAAKNTSELIETTITRIEQGTGLVKQVDQAFAELSEGAQKVSQLIGEIAAASNEQSQGLDQINTAVNQMDQVTQNNAASAEESASASEELNAQAECMMDNVQDLVRVVGGAAACRFDETGAMHRSGAAVRPKMIAGGNGGSKPDPNGRRRYTTDQNGPRRTQTVPADRQVSTDGDFGEF